MGSSSDSLIQVAVFPMPDAVLFPGVALPLQFRDDRYREMLRQAQASGCSVAVSLATAGEGEEVVLNAICGAGQVQLLEHFPDGHSEVVLLGERRVKLLDVSQEHPYLVMEAEDLGRSDRQTRSEAGFDSLKKLVQTWAFLNPDLPSALGPVFEQFETQAELTDFFVFHFVEPVELQQTYLGCTDVAARGEMLRGYLQERVEKLFRRTRRELRHSLLH